MTAPTGTQPPLRDRHGRVARDLRVSLTDRCNLRCTYCMPAEGLGWLPSELTLTGEEVVRLIRIAVEMLGIREVRFTGGEPLLRRSLEEIVAAVSRLGTPGGEPLDLSLTTNGLGLDKRARALRRAGLARVNVSLDALDRARYAEIARRDRLPDVLAGLHAAREAGLGPIKVNTVLMRGVNEEEAVPLLRFCLQHGFTLRFIEQMPLGPPHTWDRRRLVTAREIRDLLSGAFSLEPVVRPDPSAPAALFAVSAGPDHPGGTVGIIASVSEPFCAACDRTRITADGQMRPCLFSGAETDLRAPLRSGADDATIAAVWAQGMWDKPAAHGIDGPGFAQPGRTMSAIGG